MSDLSLEARAAEEIDRLRTERDAALRERDAAFDALREIDELLVENLTEPEELQRIAQSALSPSPADATTHTNGGN